jgi:hypothetical protein
MKKDAYYFPHFSNARHDRKLKRVIKDLGIEGYGIYFMVLEVLRDQQDFKYPLQDIDLLADEFGTSESKLSVVVKNYDLFDVDESNNFFSTKQALYLQPYIERSEKARNMARARWDKVKSLPEPMHKHMPEHYDSNASKVKESKVKETKEKEEVVLSTRDALFEKWFKYKREKRQSYTTTGIETLIKTWSSYTDEQLEQIVDTSISNNYSGLFAPKNYTTTKASTDPITPRTTITIPDNY